MWRLKPGQTLRLYDDPDGGEAVLYNDLSGDTHLLGAAAIDLLALLRCGPAASAALCESLAAAMERGRDPEFDAEAEALLAQLASLHLIEALPC